MVALIVSAAFPLAALSAPLVNRSERHHRPDAAGRLRFAQRPCRRRHQRTDTLLRCIARPLAYLGLVGGLCLGAWITPSVGQPIPSAPDETRDQAGVAAAVLPSIRVQPSQTVRPSTVETADTEQLLDLGAAIFRDDVIRTDEHGTTQLIFFDQTTLTIGTRSTVRIDSFVYDPIDDLQQLHLSTQTGMFRFIGGAISKRTSARIDTPHGTIGIRGSVVDVDVTPERTVVTCHLCQQITASNDTGDVRTLSGAQRSDTFTFRRTGSIDLSVTDQSRISRTAQRFASATRTQPVPDDVKAAIDAMVRDTVTSAVSTTLARTNGWSEGQDVPDPDVKASIIQQVVPAIVQARIRTAVDRLGLQPGALTLEDVTAQRAVLEQIIRESAPGGAQPPPQPPLD